MDELNQYVGLKLVQAMPQQKPGSENQEQEFPGQYHGYEVTYEDGYTSWSPKDVFEQAYKKSGEMDFSMALFMAKRGLKIARSGWNGKGMWIVLMPGLKLPPFNSQVPGAKVNDRTAKHIGPDTPLDSQPYFVMWTAAGQWQPGWLASQADMLATDWCIVS